jgi:hypothetical protein
MPPEEGAYMPRGERKLEWGDWLFDQVDTWSNDSKDQSVTRLGSLGMTRNVPLIQRYSAGGNHRMGKRTNGRLARSLKLITIACMSASRIARTTAFDTDSKQIAIDNCVHRTALQCHELTLCLDP